MIADWHHQAACRDVTPDLFFSPSHPTRQAKSACSRCAVLVPCTFDALRNPGDGYQAGLTRNDRAAIRKWDREQRGLNTRGRPGGEAS